MSASDDDTVITIADARRAFCVLGVKRWMDERGIDFRDFVENGITVGRLKELGEVGMAELLTATPPQEEVDNG